MVEKLQVGFIGLGTMGRPMAKRVFQAGYPLTVYDIVPDAVGDLIRMGASQAGSPREVAERSEVIITMLPSSPHVEQVVLGKDGVLEGLTGGSMVIDMSTIEPHVTRKVGAAVRAAGGRMIDAPVGKSAAAAAAGELTIIGGGDPADFEEARPILATMGTTIFHCGDLGAGTMVKLANNLIASVITAAISEGLVLGVKGGVKPDILLKVIGSTGASSYHLVNTFPKHVLSGNLNPSFMLDLMHKDLSLITSTGAALGVPLPVTNLIRELASVAQAKGKGKLDWTSFIQIYEEWAGVEVRLENPVI